MEVKEGASVKDADALSASVELLTVAVTLPFACFIVNLMRSPAAMLVDAFTFDLDSLGPEPQLKPTSPWMA